MSEKALSCPRYFNVKTTSLDLAEKERLLK